MPNRYSKNELTALLSEALDIFNDCLDSEINMNNLLLDFFTGADAVEVYERFCTGHFPEWLSEPYKTPGYFDDTGAQAFVSDNACGLLISADIDFPSEEIIKVFLHELSHIFCTRNEIKGGHFFDRYCMGEWPNDGLINAGYAIWREAIADIMADSVWNPYATLTLRGVRRQVDKNYNYIKKAALESSGGIPQKLNESKKAMSLIIVYVMVSQEVAGTEEWGKAGNSIRKEIGFEDDLMYTMLKLVFNKLHRSPFWEITP